MNFNPFGPVEQACASTGLRCSQNQQQFAVRSDDLDLIAVFVRNIESASGVKVDEIKTSDAEPLYRYQPEHPLAIKEGKWKGYVAYPNIDLTTQMVDALESTRAYEANVGVMDITKSISRETLTILA